MLQIVFTITLVAHLAIGVATYRFLLVPLPFGSHLSWMVDIGEHLADRGHVVDMLVPNISDTRKHQKNSKINITYFQCKSGFMLEKVVKTALEDMLQRAQQSSTGILESFLPLYYAVNQFVMLTRELFVNNRNILTKMKERQYDLAMMDGAPFVSCFFTIPYKLDIPYVTVTWGYDASSSGIPALPSFVPSQLSIFSHQMTFLQRVINFICPDIGTLRFIAPNYLVTEFVPEKPYMSLPELRRKSQLFFIDVGTPLDYPRPTLPHVIMLQGLTIKPAQQIQDVNLARFVDEASEGFIYVSLGTFVLSFPPKITEIFLSAFRQLPQRVIFRYSGSKLYNLPQNVKLVPWVPQNDLLGHPNCKLFITHCGNNGQFESLYHGVPMLGLPLFTDQPYNAQRMQAQGYGLYLHISSLTVQEFLTAIRTLTNDPRYAQKARWASEILRDDPMTSLDKITYWVEHVIKFGNGHLRSPAVDMPWYQYWMLDVIAFLVFILVLFIRVICIIAKSTLKYFGLIWKKRKIE